MKTDELLDLPKYPMARQCPFDPPPELIEIQATERVRRVSIWNGASPWLVTGFDLVRQVLADPRVSSDTDTPGFPAANAGYFARRKVAKTFINMDNPQHDALRRVVMADFTVKRAESMRPTIQQMVDGLIDDMLAGPNPTDLVQAFSLQLPSLVICEILGVPLEDRGMFFQMAKRVQYLKSSAEEAAAAQSAMYQYFIWLLDEKLREPKDDLVSRLGAQQVVTGLLTREEVAAICNMLLLGGFDTTSNMIALGTAALFEHPSTLAELRSTDDPAVIGNAAEELLRWLTILHFGRRRVALEDMEIDGHLVRAGEGIIVAHDAADRDPEAFPNPDELDIHRRARHHVAFGYGIHQCLGQSLARIELQVVYGTLYRRIPTLAPAVPASDLKFKYHSLIYGLEELPVKW